jgi:flagellar FliJ protein
MNTPGPLSTVFEHAQKLRDQALAACVQADDTVRKLRLQLDQLLTYRGEYEARDPARGGQSAPIDLVRGHFMFMQRLAQAAAQQQAQLQAAQQRAQALQEALVGQETRLAALRKLLQRRARETAHRADRAEQRQSDESAARQSWRDGAGAPTTTH